MTNNPQESPKPIVGRGKGSKNLTAKEKKFIEEHFDQAGWTDKKMAEELGRNEETITRYRKKAFLQKNISKNYEDQKTDPGGKVRISKDQEAEGRIKFWQAHLRNSTRHKILKNKLMPDDMEFFSEKWAVYHIQFEDMTATEEDTLELLIMIELRMYGNNKALKTSQLYEEDLQKQIDMLGDPQIDVEIEQQRRLRETIISNNKIQLELNKEYRELADKYEKLLRAMNATREQRESKHQVGGDTFLSLIRDFNDRDKRKDIGKYNELMKLAGENKMKEFKKPHMFADGGVEPIIMMGKDYMKTTNDGPIEPSLPLDNTIANKVGG